jgi:CDP-glucose 4,6-dehydratase
MVSQSLLAGGEHPMINIGPDEESFVTVAKVAEIVATQLSIDPTWKLSESIQPHEAGLLSLDASLAKSALGWHNKLKFSEAIKWTTDWYLKVHRQDNARATTIEQIEKFYK